MTVLRSGRSVPTLLFALLALLSTAAAAADMAATVHKPGAEVHQAADFKSATVASLRRGDAVTISGQQGLWFQVRLADGSSGFLRVTDVRMDYAAREGGDANVRALFTGQAGKGRVTETAGVRGLDESALQSAAFDAGQLAAMQRFPEAAPASFWPSPSTSSGTIPKNGRPADPGFMSCAPGRVVIMIPPVSVCHQVSTIGQR